MQIHFSAPPASAPLGPAPLGSGSGFEAFAYAFQDAAARPVTEITPVAAGDGVAAFGFAMAWLSTGVAEGPTLIVSPEIVSGENGALYPPGAAQFGLDPTRVLHVRTRTLKEALWASEQALGLPQARALCLVPHDARLTLTATRRLHLAAEKNDARCVLLRFDPPSPSAAWTRWRVAAAPSRGANRELGRPCFAVSLTRQRSGRSGQQWLLEWNAHEHAFNAADRGDARLPMAGGMAAAFVDRSPEARRRRAG